MVTDTAFDLLEQAEDQFRESIPSHEFESDYKATTNRIFGALPVEANPELTTGLPSHDDRSNVPQVLDYISYLTYTNLRKYLQEYGYAATDPVGPFNIAQALVRRSDLGPFRAQIIEAAISAGMISCPFFDDRLWNVEPVQANSYRASTLV